jgi:Dyp-type peroxidase family
MAAQNPPPLDLENVQGDILSKGLPKKTETFFFFQIDDGKVDEFRAQLAQLIPLIRTAAQALDDHKRIRKSQKDAEHKKEPKPLLKLSGVNIAFSHSGLKKLGITDDIGDGPFNSGMLATAQRLGDRGVTTSENKFSPSWDPAFKQEIHGVILITGDRHETVQATLEPIKKLFLVGEFNAIIYQILSLTGDVRPGSEKGHEHFGFLDGVSQPAVQGVDTNPNPGQDTIRQGIILVGRDGDALDKSRPSWALDGSFLAFRYLFQLVPEFDLFLKSNPIPGLPPDEGSELLGARLVGRWKSGAPIDLTPIKDDPALGADPSRNDQFAFDPKSQDRCPFAAHVRKTNPRADLTSLGISTETRRIMRQGIAFGPEVSAEEKSQNKTGAARGLLFVCYQSNISDGFEFIQESWANNPNFPIQKNEVPGFDPIIGQTNDGGVRTLSGTNPANHPANLDLPTEWVVSKGGEYFFSPSISALEETFAKVAKSDELKVQ